jgi:hypothetical protein
VNVLQAPGRRISSRNTFFLKRVLPLLLLAVLLLAVALPLVLVSSRGGRMPYAAVVGPVCMGIILTLVFRRLVFDLADEVTDEGEALRVRFGHEEERVALADIINVSYAGITNPPRVTLTLRHPGRFGREITFSPQQSFLAPLVGRNALVNELIDRVEAARQR